jgi:hypothetical protein
MTLEDLDGAWRANIYAATFVGLCLLYCASAIVVHHARANPHKALVPKVIFGLKGASAPLS